MKNRQVFSAFAVACVLLLSFGCGTTINSSTTTTTVSTTTSMVTTTTLAGTTWVQATAEAAFQVRRSFCSVAFNNNMWVIGGSGIGPLKNDVWYSSDGINWTEATPAAAFAGRYSHSSVVFDDKIWVIGGMLAA